MTNCPLDYFSLLLFVSVAQGRSWEPMGGVHIVEIHYLMEDDDTSDMTGP